MIDKEIVLDELDELFSKDKAYQQGFASLTVEQRVAFIDYFSCLINPDIRAKKMKSNKKRIELGFSPKECYCGQSSTMPKCDGTHKDLKE
jgi:hypothetical protein